jgi:hypothetical protein
MHILFITLNINSSVNKINHIRFTSHKILKSFCSTLKSITVDDVITVAFLGVSYKIDSPKAAPASNVQISV